MSQDDVKFFNGENFEELKNWLGKRPGDYHVDPFYVRRVPNLGNKLMIWDAHAKKWHRITPGTMIAKRSDGTVFYEPPRRTA